MRPIRRRGRRAGNARRGQIPWTPARRTPCQPPQQTESGSAESVTSRSSTWLGCTSTLVDPAVRIQCVAGSQQTRPVRVRVLLGRRIRRELSQQQRNRELSALDEAPELHETPPLVSVHGRPGHACERVDLRGRLRVEVLWRDAPDILNAQALYSQVRQIQARPHFCADAVAHLSSILTP